MENSTMTTEKLNGSQITMSNKTITDGLETIYQRFCKIDQLNTSNYDLSGYLTAFAQLINLLKDKPQ
jgi:hypothetical protein